MAAEVDEIPMMISRQLAVLDAYRETGRMLKRDGVRGIITCARGTSDHAATFFKYLMETYVGLPVASIGPSVASIYGANLRLNGFSCLTFSQSGGSPDLVLLQRTAKKGGARTIAILNVTESPVGNDADHILPILAGPEKAVAATKSFVGMLVASLGLVAGYRADNDIVGALADLPDLTRDALKCDWSVAMQLAQNRSLYCVGRGFNMAIALEAALKIKEICCLHAEAYSAAELLHGPVRLADERFGALVFGTQGCARKTLTEAYMRLRRDGASAYLVGSVPELSTLPVTSTNNEILEPVLQVVAFYRFVENLSVAMGHNPDAPTGLRKVTETV
ncbi:MAG: SIS domain-containing protein [Aestuariivita sp.]|nr:SIS domain-containing protein [Aestuariivita sp.]